MWGFIGVEYLCYITKHLELPPLPTHHTIYNPHKNPHSHTPFAPVRLR